MQGRSTDTSIRHLLVLGCTSVVLYGVVLILSARFSYETEQTSRPLLTTLSVFGVLSAVYLIAICVGVRSRSTKLVPTIVGFSVAFRGVMLFSEPIQEIDIYRYIWDGVASTAGVSPFEFAPHEVLQAELNPSATSPLQRLVQKRESSDAVRTLLERVHYGELPTVYPPVSQAIFALAAWTTPPQASPSTRIVWMKAWLLLFDIATIWIVAATLKLAQVHPGWITAYAWCPLVLKEFANSGHLDSIAVFLTSVAVYFTGRAFFRSDMHSVEHSSFANALLGSLFLALAVGAKLYPIALTPLFACTSFKRLGGKQTLVLAIAFLTAMACCLAPLGFEDPSESVLAEPNSNPFAPVSDAELQPEAPPLPAPPSSDRRAGLKAFLGNWMMNDLIFLNIAENVTPDQLRDDDATPWFVLLPNSARTLVVARVAGWLSIEEARTPFFIARTVTAAIFVSLALYWAWRSMHVASLSDWLEFVFLTMAWFWLLLPTLNPWYWIWALPWIAYARNRVWVAMSSLLFIYYLRFHFGAHFSDAQVLSFAPYFGEAFFDYVVVWFEYVPWFTALIAWRVANRSQQHRAL